MSSDKVVLADANGNVKTEEKPTSRWHETLSPCPMPSCRMSGFVYIRSDFKEGYCGNCSSQFSILDIEGDIEFSPETLQDIFQDGQTESDIRQARYQAEEDEDDAFDTDGTPLIDVSDDAGTTFEYPSPEMKAAFEAAEAALDKDAAIAASKLKPPSVLAQEAFAGVQPTKQAPLKQTYGSAMYSHGDTSGMGWEQRTFGNFCNHAPQHVIAGEGWGVWAGKRTDVIDHANHYDLVLNLTFDSIKNNHVIPVPELAKYADNGCTFTELQIDWPDYGVTTLPRAFWEDLTNHLKKHRLRMLVFCQGGHGRTGTAIASLLVVAMKYGADEATAWVRKNYCGKAVETWGQERYVEKMDLNYVPKPKGEAPKGMTKKEKKKQKREYFKSIFKG